MEQKYEEMLKTVNTRMAEANKLGTEHMRRGFVNRLFREIHKAYEGKQIDHAEYVKLVNRLSRFRGGEYNDYLDTLTGAASMGMLEFAIQGEVSQFSPDASRKRSKAVTDLTGIDPVKEEE